jgi:hypothetical protein
LKPSLLPSSDFETLVGLAKIEEQDYVWTATRILRGQRNLKRYLFEGSRIPMLQPEKAPVLKVSLIPDSFTYAALSTDKESPSLSSRPQLPIEFNFICVTRLIVMQSQASSQQTNKSSW